MSVMWNVVWNYGDEERGICKVMRDCCVTSDVENDAMCCQTWWRRWCQIKMWWCNAMWNMVVVWNVLWCWIWVWCGTVVGVEWCETWTVQWCRIYCALRCGAVKWRCEADCSVRWCQMYNMVVRGEMCCDIRCLWDVEWNMRYVVMCYGMLCNGSVMVFWCDAMEWCVMWKRLTWCWVVWMKCNLNPTNYINTTALV